MFKTVIAWCTHGSLTLCADCNYIISFTFKWLHFVQLLHYELCCQETDCSSVYFSFATFSSSLCRSDSTPSGAHAEMKFQLAHHSQWKLWMFRKFNIDFYLSQRYGSSIEIVVTTLRPTFLSLHSVSGSACVQMSVAVKWFCSWPLPVRLLPRRGMKAGAWWALRSGGVCHELWWVFTSRTSLITAVLPLCNTWVTCMATMLDLSGEISLC